MADTYVLGVKIKADDSEFNAKMAAVQAKMSSVSGKLQTMSGKLKSVGSSLTNHITKPALAATSAIAGIALFKGWNRMTAIDNARAKLLALGNSAKQVDQIMQDALKSVKGTAFGLDEAGTTAAAAVASGIKPGKELTNYLRTIADTAAIAGRSMSDMGAIFNKVAAKGRVDAEILNQLSDAGVPALQLLAKEMGVTSAEISEMVSKGEVDFATFQKAMAAGVDGAAVKIGSTTITGALSNINAAISRIGANFLGASTDSESFAGQLLGILNNVQAKLGVVEEKATEWGKTFGRVFLEIRTYISDGVKGVEALDGKTSKYFKRLQPVVDLIQGIIERFSEMSTGGKIAFATIILGIGPFLTMLGKIIGVVSSVMGAIGGMGISLTAVKGILLKLAGPIGIIITVISLFTTAYSKSEKFRESVNKIISALSGSFTSIWKSVSPILTTIFDVITEIVVVLAEALAPIAERVGTTVAGVLTTIANVITLLSPALTLVINLIGKVLTVVIKVLTPIINLITKVATGIINAVAEVINFVVDVVTAIASFIKTIIQAIVDHIENRFYFIKGIILLFAEGVKVIFEAIKAVILAVWTVIKNKADEIWASIKNKILAILSPVIDVFTSIKNKVLAVWDAIKTRFNEMKNNIVNGAKTMLDPAINAFNKLKNSVKSAIDKILGWWSNLKSTISKGISGVISIGKTGKVKNFASGTKNFEGGFARINEGGRGELTLLPSGTQIVPHDISKTYAKEAARMTSGGQEIDYSAMGQAMEMAIRNGNTGLAEQLAGLMSNLSIKYNNREFGRVVADLL